MSSVTSSDQRERVVTFLFGVRGSLFCCFGNVTTFCGKNFYHSLTLENTEGTEFLATIGARRKRADVFSISNAVAKRLIIHEKKERLDTIDQKS